MTFNSEESPLGSHLEATKAGSIEKVIGMTPMATEAVDVGSISTNPYLHVVMGNRDETLSSGRVTARERVLGDAGKISEAAKDQISSFLLSASAQLEILGRTGTKIGTRSKVRRTCVALCMASKEERETTTTSTRESTRETSLGGILGRMLYGLDMVLTNMTSRCHIGASMTIGSI